MALRSAYPMNVCARLPGRGWSVAVQKDIDRIATMWSEQRAQHVAAGPFLFGRFSVADAYCAPVVWRFVTYAPALPAPVRAYMDTMLALPAMRDWAQAAAEEGEFVLEDEPYRSRPG